MKGIKPISPGCFNYFLMRICSFRKFTHDNGRPEPFTPSRARPCSGHAWLGPAAPTPGLLRTRREARDGEPGARVPLTTKNGRAGQINQKYRRGPIFAICFAATQNVALGKS